MAVLGSLELIRKRLPEDPKLTALLDNATQGADRGVVSPSGCSALPDGRNYSKTIDIPDLVRGMSDLLQRSLGQSIKSRPAFR